MEERRFDRDFLKQFRHGYIVYPCSEEKSYQHLLFRQFAGHAYEIAMLEETISDKLQQAGLVRQLILQIEKEVIPDSSRLSDFIKELVSLFSSCREPQLYTHDYYTHLTSALNCFVLLVDTFLKETREHLAADLKAFYFNEAGPNDEWSLDSTDVGKTKKVIEYYQAKLLAYYDYFTAYLQREPPHQSDATPITREAWYLKRLITYTVKIRATIESTRAMMSIWETQLANTEMQELYN